MRIYADGKQLDIPVWITATDNTITVNTPSTKINDRDGEYLQGGTYYAVRIFNCSGNIPTDKYKDVEHERSRLFNLLAGKELHVYRDDDDDIFYKCRLEGTVKTTYNDGFNLAKVFSISFQLKAIEPFGFGETVIKKIHALEQKETIHCEGNYPTLPEIELSGIASVKGLLLESGNTYLEVSSKIDIPIGDSLIYKNGLLFLNGEDITINLTDRCILNPLTFQAGKNKLKITITGGTVKITYNGRYM
ncbi:phage tail domain-containing protein [Treponema phagedenis]|uniref:phage tail domain-containing protein n=1 Tax=Treponema phagedenis TaxID=162 RepID=UPI0015837164|nr:phage tail domain-containing protein [Treponema phagedenis]NVP22723.1 phage tail family protein [Treponema phagedenis]NVP23228.1 phage tail family protein [Treponema phagedenis]QKS92557.1 phage tail family protein [Treponema phagedenis]QLC57630.1 phage tail family protein [Treponema phagedenis]QLC58089.1 phage tail family protein [Treponema phagedenis]